MARMPEPSNLDTLRTAIAAYAFPAVTYDFDEREERVHDSMTSVESSIRAQLLHDDAAQVRNGLSNVLYWGYARSGYRDHRVADFRRRVTEAQLDNVRTLFRHLGDPGLRDVVQLGLPAFSRMSFVSKVRMFLDPTRYVTLDLKLAQLRLEPAATVLRPLKVETSIRVSKANVEVYKNWCELCRTLADTGFPGEGLRAADVERGVFHLVDEGRARLAAHVLDDWRSRQRPHPSR